MSPLTSFVARSVVRVTRGVSKKPLGLVHGFYGARNVGDDAILEATAASIRGVGLAPLVVGWSPGAVREAVGLPAISARRSVSPLYRPLCSAGAFLLGGGGLVKDYGGSPKSLAHWMSGLRLASALGVPTMTWSVGVDPLVFPESLAHVADTLSRVDIVTVRDAESAERLRDAGVRRDVVVTADPVPAYVASHRGAPRLQGSEPHVAVALRHWFVSSDTSEDPAAFDRAIRALAGAFDALHKRTGARFSFVPLRAVPGDDDRLVASRVVSEMMTSAGRVVKDPAPSVAQTIRRLRDVDVVVAMRLHAAVIATTLGVPTVGLAYAPKVRSFFEALGMDDFCRSVDDVDAGWVVERVTAALRDYVPLRARLIGATNRMVSAYEVNERALRGLL